MTVTTTTELTTFIDTLFDANDIIEVRCLPAGRSSFYKAGELADFQEELARVNCDKQNIHYGANPRKAEGTGVSARDCTPDDPCGKCDCCVTLARCLFCDFDHCTEPVVRAKLLASGLPQPTIILYSGHGVHTYWRLTEPVTDLVAWSILQTRLAQSLGGDPVVKNPARLMRLPVFTNHKTPAAPCFLLDVDPTRIYDLAQLAAKLPELAKQAATPDADRTHPPSASNPANLAIIAEAANRLSKIPPAIEGQNGDARTYKAACALVSDFGLTCQQAWPLLCEWNRSCQPPWNDASLATKLDNALAYAKGGKSNKTSPADSVPTPGPPWYTVEDLISRDDYWAGLPAITTGYGNIDRSFRGGFREESTYVLAGRTGSAKSTLAANMARRVSLSGHCVLLFKLEESPLDAVWRIHASASQGRLNTLLDGAARDPDVKRQFDDGLNIIRDLPLRISDARELAEIRRIARQHADTGGELIIVDQLSMIDVYGAESAYERVTAASNALRLLARDLHVPILIVAQINRLASRGKDHLSVNDLRDSGSIENDAAGVIFIDEVREQTPSYGDKCYFLELQIAKNRYGPTTRPDEPIELAWWPATARIEAGSVDCETSHG